MISKPAILRREDKYMILEILLKVKASIFFFIYRLIYQNLMVTKNQKSIIDTHTTKEKESKHNTKFSHQITRKQKGKKIRGKKASRNKSKTINKMAIRTYISIISLNISRFSTPTKIHRLAERIHK